MLKKIPRQVFYIVAALIILGGLLAYANFSEPKTTQVSVSKMIEQANAGQVEKIEVSGDNLTITLKDGTKEESIKESNANLKDYGIDYGKVKVEVKNPDTGLSKIFDFLLAVLPIALIIGFFYFIMRQAQGSNNQAMSFGKSKARVFGLEKDSRKEREHANSSLRIRRF